MTDARITDHGHPQALSDLSVIRDCYVVSIVDNFDSIYLDALEQRLLPLLSKRNEIRGVIFSFNEVVTTDQYDLRRLKDLLKSIRLMGGRVGLCCINPGLAAVMVTSNLNFHQETIGSEIDDLLHSL